MEEQVCDVCELAGIYVGVINNSKSDEELFEILHGLIEDVRLDAQLEIVEHQADAWKDAKYKILKELED